MTRSIGAWRLILEIGGIRGEDPDMGSLGATIRGAIQCLVIALVVGAPASALGLPVIDLPLLPPIGGDGSETTTTSTTTTTTLLPITLPTLLTTTTSTTTTTTLLPITLPTLLTTTTTQAGDCGDGDECTSTTSTTTTSATSTTVAATTTTASTPATTSTTVAGDDDGVPPPSTPGSTPAGTAPSGSQGLEALDMELLSPAMAGVVALLMGQPDDDQSDDAAHRDGAGTMSDGMYHLLAPVLPPAVVDAVLSPLVILDALLEALVSSGQALIVPGVAFFLGFGVPGIRRRVTLGAAVASD